MRHCSRALRACSCPLTRSHFFPSLPQPPTCPSSPHSRACFLRLPALRLPRQLRLLLHVPSPSFTAAAAALAAALAGMGRRGLPHSGTAQHHEPGIQGSSRPLPATGRHTAKHNHYGTVPAARSAAASTPPACPQPWPLGCKPAAIAAPCCTTCSQGPIWSNVTAAPVGTYKEFVH